MIHDNSYTRTMRRNSDAYIVRSAYRSDIDEALWRRSNSSNPIGICLWLVVISIAVFFTFRALL